MTTLFASNNTATAVSSNGRQLAGTATLTNIANTTARKILDSAKTDEDAYSPMIARSMTDATAIDDLIILLGDIESLDTDFLLAIGEDTLESMLKSQQSKKSRTKGKVMTEENYISLVSSAVAEMLLRLALGKEKTAGNRGPRGNSEAFTDERLAELAADQETLRKEIRNVQSKKSIMKSKADFSETDDRWLVLLEMEAQLKDIRVTGTASTKVVEVDKIRVKLQEALAEVDIEKMKAAEAKELLAFVKFVVFDNDEDPDVTLENKSTEDAE